MSAAQPAERSLMKKYFPVAFFFALMFAALYAYSALRTEQASSLEGKTVISQSLLEEKYGLRVNLMAVTAAGGMVDVRLKLIDGGKARLLLEDKANFPTLFVADGSFTLTATSEAKPEEIKFEDGGNLFLLFPNTVNSVKTGTYVTLVFGDTVLEPILVK